MGAEWMEVSIQTVKDLHHFLHSVSISMENEIAASSNDEMCILVMDDENDHLIDDDFHHSSDSDDNQ